MSEVHKLRFSFEKPFKYRQLLAELGIPVLFVGAETCFYHRQVAYREADVTALTPTSADVSLGTWEDSVFEAACGVVDRDNATALILYITCLVDFVGIDYDAIASDISRKKGIACFVLRDCRICSNRRPFPVSPHKIDDGVMRRRIFPNPDPPSLLCSILKEVSQRPRVPENARCGLLVPCDTASFDQDNDLRSYMQQVGEPLYEAYRLDSQAKVDLAAASRAVLVCQRNMLEVAGQLSEALDIPLLYLPLSFSLSEVDAAYRQLEQIFGKTPEPSMRRAAAQESIERFSARYAGSSFELLLDGLAEPWTFMTALMDLGISISDAGGTPLSAKCAYDAERSSCGRLQQEFPTLYKRVTCTREQAADRIGPDSQWGIRCYIKQTNGWKLEDVVRGRSTRYDESQDFQLIQQECWGYLFVQRFFDCMIKRTDNTATPILE